MSVILYTTGCPQCKLLENKLDAVGIQYERITNVETMIANGFISAPVLIADGKTMKFMEAMKWINEVNA